MNIVDDFRAQWIWMPQEEEKVNQYVEFRHEFMLEDQNVLPDSKIYISADTEYAVWLNGVFLNCGQYDDYPDHKVYDTLPTGPFLKIGKNVLCVLAYYQGVNSFQYIKGIPRLMYSLAAGETHITSGMETFCRESLTYKSGPVDVITPQLSFSFEYNAAAYDGWLSEAYVLDQSWKTSNDVGKLTGVLNERPISKLDIKDIIGTQIASQGVFLRQMQAENTIAQMMQTDFLSYRLTSEIFAQGDHNELPSLNGIDFSLSKLKNEQGIYVLLDLGKEEAGLLTLELDTGEGTVIDISYGEHLDDLRVRAAIGVRNFAARYTCRQGRQAFTHWFKRIAGRYIQLHVSNIQEKFTLYYAGVRPAEYPVAIKGSFRCPDHLFTRIHDVSIRTLHLCMHEHYEDTPWREQALYGMDSRMQALCGYYCFGEYDFPIASFELLGNSLKDDGYLEICAPTEHAVTIPSFNMAWIMELWDYLLYSGKVERVRLLLPKIKKMLASYLGTLKNDLMVTPGSPKFWNFYEWADGLENAGASQRLNQGLTNRFDAPLNLFLCMALEAAENIARYCGEQETARSYSDYASRIKKAFHPAFWDETNKAYQSYHGEGVKEHYAELVQSLALCSGACPENVAQALRETLAEEDNQLVKTTLSYSLYKYQALMGEPRKYGKFVFDQIARDWGTMLYKGATSFWETIKGADDFNRGGSLSHGWSATPIYFFYAHLLGVKPLEPGFKTFKVDPAYWVISDAEGTVPTPYGNIDISFTLTDSGGIKLQTACPEETTMIREGLYV